jgi:catalase
MSAKPYSSRPIGRQVATPPRLESPPKAHTPAPAVPTLADQQADFTAEGSPPPGKVSTSVPVTRSPDPPTK